VNLENVEKLILNAPENSTATPYIQEVKWNGKNYPNSWLSHREMLKGAIIDFRMGEK